MASVKNIAIIAHVDHGKTTLVDELLKYCSALGSKDQSERILDSNELERERGITIFSKNTAVEYKQTKINIVDTPGHSDFGGEVERVLRMVDACLLLVDAVEGPMPQTRFVLEKALQLGHKIILVINKIDKPEAEPDRVIEETLELFLELNASNEQINFPIVYASAKEGFAIQDMQEEKKDISPLLDTILEHAPSAGGAPDKPLKFQVTTLDYNDYIGRICIGRSFDGKLKVGDSVFLLGIDEQKKMTQSTHKVSKLFTFLGLEKIAVDEASEGDIFAVAGIPEMTIGDTLTSEKEEKPLPRIEIEPPTVSMLFRVNSSPLAGREGKFLTTRQIRERLEKELLTNLSLQMEEVEDGFQVAGRGELHLAILIENMRREGFELGVSKPKVILKEIDGVKMEPFESVVLNIPEEFSGGVIQELNRRKGMLVQMDNPSDSSVKIKYEIATRGLIGFRSFLLTETRGRGTSWGIFLGYRNFAGHFSGRSRGALVSMADGMANSYALFNLQERGDLFIGAQTQVYEGMIIGLHAKETNLDVNPVKEKKMTNMRSSGSDDALRLTPPKQFSLEQAMDVLEDDEVLEVTPHELRLRKKELKANLRKRSHGK